ncbi:MAG: hypothetical protein MZV65_15165 [Chromatiales bacterium]|nr:hypothetical protein [Chromatiales bacterium]
MKMLSQILWGFPLEFNIIPILLIRHSKPACARCLIKSQRSINLCLAHRYKKKYNPPSPSFYLGAACKRQRLSPNKSGVIRTISISTAASNRSMIVTASCSVVARQRIAHLQQSRVRRQQWPFVALLGQSWVLVDDTDSRRLAKATMNKASAFANNRSVTFFTVQIKVRTPGEIFGTVYLNLPQLRHEAGFFILLACLAKCLDQLVQRL